MTEAEMWKDVALFNKAVADRLFDTMTKVISLSDKRSNDFFRWMFEFSALMAGESFVDKTEELKDPPVKPLMFWSEKEQFEFKFEKYWSRKQQEKAKKITMRSIA